MRVLVRGSELDTTEAECDMLFALSITSPLHKMRLLLFDTEFHYNIELDLLYL